MNLSAGATMDYKQTRNACWSGEWSFIEDSEMASNKPTRPPIAEKLSLVYQAIAGSTPAHPSVKLS